MRGKVWYIFDGDTVSVSVKNEMLCVRLDAIDCPEGGQEWGDNAKAGLFKMVYGREVELEIHGVDIYGRTLATLYVWYGNELRNVNESMVMKGHAWVYRKYYAHLPQERRQQLLSIERWARSKRAGLWRVDNPIAPWDWRKQA